MMEQNIIHNEDCLTGLKKLPDECIDCCVTSPPYWGLRNYENEFQVGQEDTHLEFIEKLLEIFTEVKRVLKPAGTCFINLGDCYSGSGRGGQSDEKRSKNSQPQYMKTSINSGIPHKSLMLIPERFAIDMINSGWILRNEIIWNKPNPMPESVKDRFTVDFEKIFFFVKSRKYFFEQQMEKTITKDAIIRDRETTKLNNTPGRRRMNGLVNNNYDAKNKRTTWKIATKPHKEAHFAVYPEKLIEIPIKAGCPENGIVLDPFIGSGTTAIVARKLNRNFIGYEINENYINIANKRLYKELGMFNA